MPNRGRHGLHQARRGIASLEFAILALPFLMLTLGTLEVGYDFLAQAALDTAVQNAARLVQTGSAQRASGQNVAQFVQNAFCPALAGMLDCSQLYVSVTEVPSGTGQNYYSYLAANPFNVAAMTGSSNTICTGKAGQFMLVQAAYLGPSFLGLLVPAFSQVSPVNGGQFVHVSYAATGFINENFSGAGAC